MSLAQNQNHQMQSQFNVNWVTPDNFTGRKSNWNLSGSNVSLNNQTQSSSGLDLINNNKMIIQDKERLKAFLPGYRPAPDYETAVRQKYRTNDSELQFRLQQSSRVASDPHLSVHSGSQPDVHRVAAIADVIFGEQLKQIPDVTRNANSVHHQLPTVSLAQHLQMMRINKLSPPYHPANRLSSTSTPNLATESQTRALCQQAYVTGSSPDLLSTRTFSNSYQMATHQHSIPTNAFRYRHSQGHNGNVQSNNQQAYDGPYRASNYHHQQQQGLIGSCHQLSGSIEPIYENQIYESHSDITNAKMRDRASSIQSAAGMIRQMQSQQRQPGLINAIVTGQHQIRQNSQSLESMNQISRMSNTPADEHSQMNRRHAPLDSLNRSKSTNVLDPTSPSDLDNTDHRNSKDKKKRRWKFWGGRGKSSLSEKPKGSSTFGWYKDKISSKSSQTHEEEMNSWHRWSTGLPRLPLPTTISKDKLCHILEEKLADPQLYLEFERIPKRKANARYDCAMNEENRKKNFNSNFLPFDDNRVRLTPTRDNRLGYYNASHVTATVGSKQRFYIIAQSPHDVSALSTFLQCVWEADVYLLIQLSDEVDYVPPTCDKCLEYGQFQIWKEFSEVTDRCVTSKLRLYHTVSRRYRSVWHLSCFNWGEQNCPKDVSQFLEFLDELRSVRLASINEVPPGHNTNPPVMIHCIEGSGRAGVTLAADLLLYTLDHNQDLDLPRVLSQLREQRDNIVPSLAQYKFVYAMLISYLKRSRLI